VPVTFPRAHDNGVAGFEIVAVAAVRLNAHAALDDKEPLRTGVPMPVRSSTVGECDPIHADRNAGLVMSQALDRRLADEGRRIHGTDRRVTRSKDAHRTLRLLHLEAVDLHFGHVIHTEPDDAIGCRLEL